MKFQNDFLVPVLLPVRLIVKCLRWGSGTMGIGSSRRKSFRSEATVGTSPSPCRSTLSPSSNRFFSFLVRTTEPHRRNRPLWCNPADKKTKTFSYLHGLVCWVCIQYQWRKQELLMLPSLLRNSTMSLNTIGIPHTVCPSSFSVPKATPNTHLAGSSDSQSCVGARGSGLTLALGRRILTDDGLLCVERGHTAADSNTWIKLFHE